MTTDKNMLSSYLKDKNNLDMPIPDELVIPLALQELQKRDTQLAEARDVIEPFANRSKEFVVMVGGMGTIDMQKLFAAAAYLAKYPKR